MEKILNFNGIDATSGQYLMPPINSTQLSKVAQGLPLNEREVSELQFWNKKAKTGNRHMGVKEGVDANKLEEAGWGVIFPTKTDPRIREALSELLDWRREQVTRIKSKYYYEFSAETGYKPGESKPEFLGNRGAATDGPADPDKMPYYLLIVGDPEEIPYRFQFQLDIQYAVGRIHFNNLEDYYNYAHSVVLAEKSGISLPPQAVFFGVHNRDDEATKLSAEQLVQPLAQHFRQEMPGWQVQSVLAEEATKDRLHQYMGGKQTPSLLFTASHGIGFPMGHKLQRQHQGALVCQDWPGPRDWLKPIPQDFYFSGEDIESQADVFGLLVFMFACYGAGTPRRDEFAQAAFEDYRADIAERAFLAALPQRLLAHPRGGALAVIGHVERAWGYSFFSDFTGKQLETFQSSLSKLMKGAPIGAAFDYFNVRYAELSAGLNEILEEIPFGKQPNPDTLAGMWTANNDARNYVILGDPAVRLVSATEADKATTQRPVVLNFPAPPAHLSGAIPDSPLPGETASPAGAALPSRQSSFEAPVGGKNAETLQMKAEELDWSALTSGRLYSPSMDMSYPMPQQETIEIGRRDAASSIYPDIDLVNQGQDSQSVSRRHARILIQNQQLFIEDLGSSNGSYLNGARIESGVRYQIKNGDELRLGVVRLVYIAK